MPVNWTRGFRRIGWLLTFSMAVLIVLFFYESTKAFSPADYDVRQEDPRLKDPRVPWDVEQDEPGLVKLPELGDAYFLPEVPKDVAEKILSDFVAKASFSPEIYLDDQGNPMRPHWTFTVYKQVNKLKLAGLIAGSTAISALFIQGSISILAWVFRGFKG